MTYDPFSYGQVNFDGEGEAKPDSPDDILFEDAGPMPEPTFGTEESSSDWELPEPSADPLLESLAGSPGRDGAESAAADLGFGAPAHPEPASPTWAEPVSGRPDSAATKFAGAGAEPYGQPQPQRQPQRRIVATRPLPRREPRRRMRVLGALVPPLCFAAGAGGAAWFYLVEQNLAMAGIVAVSGVIGTAFTRLLFR